MSSQVNENSKKPLLEKGIVLNGKWKIIDHLASGGKGEVYRARQVNLDRIVAIKIVSAELLASFGEDEEEMHTEMERFRREVLTMAKVRHPNILQVYDQDQAVVEKDGKELKIDYIAMEYIPGPTLRTTIPQGGLRKDERLLRKWIREYLFPILDGVGTIHNLGIIHRDLKPENILLDEFTPKIADFGLAAGPYWQPVTRSHHMDGTIPYMSREQIMDLGESDVRADIYALGKILYEAVIGKMGRETAFPFKTARIPDPDSPFLKKIDRVIQQATADEKGKRFSSVKVLRKELAECVGETEEIYFQFVRERARRQRAVVTAIILAIIASIGFHIFYHREQTNHSTAAKKHEASERDLTGVTTAEETVSLPTDRDRYLPPTRKGNDGLTLHMIPEGNVVLPAARTGDGETKSYHVKPFYLDETEITIHHYVDFLNQNLSKITVEKGVVKAKDRIWLMLGKVLEDYEPIVYQNGRFIISDAAFAAYPVVRVTAYGAEAYARFYGKRLPTEIEWLHARGPEENSPEQSAASGKASLNDSSGGMSDMHGTMMQMMQPQTRQEPQTSISPKLRGLASVVLSEPNKYGVRGLVSNANEWAVRARAFSQEDESSTTYVILGGGQSKSTQTGKDILGLERFPWEAFDFVGFRCAAALED